jgi:hypothetical protein
MEEVRRRRGEEEGQSGAKIITVNNYAGGMSPSLTDISHDRLLFRGVLSAIYTDCVPFELVDSASLLYEVTAAVEGEKIVFLNLTTQNM